MNQNIIETVVGFMVLLIAIGCVILAYQSGSVKRAHDGYQLAATFNNVDGIHIGSRVKIAGINIGEVSEVNIDPSTYKAKVAFFIDSNSKLPSDSSVSVVSSGLIGEKYLAVTPGSDAEFLRAGSSIEFTQSSINLEDLLGKFMFGLTNSDKKDK